MSKFVPNKRLDLFTSVLDHMNRYGGSVQLAKLLAGDPGVGKTTFVKQLSALTGIPAVILEVPHISEEHLINIPFLVVDGTGGKGIMKKSVEAGEGTPPDVLRQYKMVLANSVLYDQLTTSAPKPDNQYLQYMSTKADPYVQKVFKMLGGTEDTIPRIIKQARQKAHVILFLDEFYRSDSPRIFNILRGIYDGRLGLHKLPKTVYPIYASNMKDEGLSVVPENHAYAVTDFPTPTKDDWFSWFISEYQNNPRVHLNMDVIRKFQACLEDVDMSFDEGEEMHRQSPRRWEQILLYVNSSLPVKNNEEASALLSYVRNVLREYSSRTDSHITNKVLQAVQELIIETSGGEIKGAREASPHEWRQVLKHAVERAMKLGESRKYVPIVAGLPGIGKTKEMVKIAGEEDLILIDINVASLNAEDAQGIPVPKDQTGDKIKVKFSVPLLHRIIMNKANAGIAEKHRELIDEFGEEEGNQKYQEFMNQEWKFLIFLDELNRVDVATFNALRRVLLEKSFGPNGDKDENGDDVELKIPEGSIMVGAINPEGEGTSKFTKHFQDSIESIHAEPSWKLFMDYLSKVHNPDSDSDVARNIAIEFTKSFFAKFGHKNKNMSKETSQFFLDFGEGEPFYIQPRIIQEMVGILESRVISIIDYSTDHPDEDEETQLSRLEYYLFEAIKEALSMELEYKTTRGVDMSGVWDMIREWVSQELTNPDSEALGSLITYKAATQESIEGILTRYLDGSRSVKDMTSDRTIDNLLGTLSKSEVVEQFVKFVTDSIDSDAAAKKYVIDQTESQIDMDGDGNVKETGNKCSPFQNVMTMFFKVAHDNKYEYGTLNAIRKGVSNALSAVTNKATRKVTDPDVIDQLMDAAYEINADVTKALRAIKPKE